MMWPVRILEAQGPGEPPVFDVIATAQDAAPDENPDILFATYATRLRALVAARCFTNERGKVIPFPTDRRVA